jgi:hypothetical protein
MTDYHETSRNELELSLLFNSVYTFTYKKQKRTFSRRHCPICYSYIRKNNVVLNCTHNCCFPCFYKYIEGAYAKKDFPICFICRENIYQLDISNHEHIEKIQDIRKYCYVEPIQTTTTTTTTVNLNNRYTSYFFMNSNSLAIIQSIIFFYLLYWLYINVEIYIIQ